jgi:hydrogenase maturation protease
MSREQAQELANAVLYEGYLLYPYRQSAIKNRQRWTFGAVYPRAYSEANGGCEPWLMRTECLVCDQGNAQTALTISVRFLHLLLRTTGPQAADASSYASESNLASRLAYEPCEEGIEREVLLTDLSLKTLSREPSIVKIAFPGQRIVDGPVERVQRPIEGIVRLFAERVDAGLYKLCVQIENTTPETALTADRHNEVLLQAFISTHTILQVHSGAFISLLEPPDELLAPVRACQNVRTWPVLIGEAGEHDTLLSSPIILYDYPQIAPESPGALFDGTEIDEILALRILTLSDEEKAEIRQGDPRAREILERTETMTPEQFMQLHGTIRSMRPVDEGAEV